MPSFFAADRLQFCCLLLAVCLFSAACSSNRTVQASDTEPAHAELIDAEIASAEAFANPVVMRYAEARTPGVAFSLLDLSSDPGAQAAIEIFQDSDFWNESRQQIAEGNLLVEFFSVVEPNAGDVSPEHCGAVEACRRIELYDYTNNATLTAYIDLRRGQVSDSFVQARSAPDIPVHLIEVTEALAANSTAINAMRTTYDVESDEANMSATKTNLSRSRCERQEHLCVAPTFTNDEGAVWAIVDLTDLRVAGAAWTQIDGDTGTDAIEPVTLRRAEEVLIQNLCDNPQELSAGPWTGTYQLTSSDGLHIRDLSFEGELVATSIKLVDWHVSYSIEAGFGYSDAVGCPAFAQAAVVAADLPTVRAIDDSLGAGVSLDQDYWSEAWPAPCSYNYRQSLRLYDDGTFRPVATSQGKGCGDNGIYRPVFRIGLPANLSTVNDGAIDQEQWLQTATGTDTFQLGADYELLVPTEPLEADEQSRPAWVYFTQGQTSAEGSSELVTIGPCCNTDYRQGPEQFIDDEPLTGSDTVVWVVPELHNDPTPGQEACWVRTTIGQDGLSTNEVAPCSAGPVFQPLEP